MICDIDKSVISIKGAIVWVVVLQKTVDTTVKR